MRAVFQVVAPVSGNGWARRLTILLMAVSLASPTKALSSDERGPKWAIEIAFEDQGRMRWRFKLLMAPSSDVVEFSRSVNPYS
jgi:hypothetical protein